MLCVVPQNTADADSQLIGAFQSLIGDLDILLMVAVQSLTMLPLPLSLRRVYLTGRDKVIYGGIKTHPAHTVNLRVSVACYI